jgi:hypothetical protein
MLARGQPTGGRKKAGCRVRTARAENASVVPEGLAGAKWGSWPNGTSYARAQRGRTQRGPPLEVSLTKRAHGLVSYVSGNRERGGRGWRRGVAYVQRTLGCGEYEVVNKPAIAAQRLGSHARERWFHVCRAQLGYVSRGGAHECRAKRRVDQFGCAGPPPVREHPPRAWPAERVDQIAAAEPPKSVGVARPNHQSGWADEDVAVDVLREVDTKKR